MKKNYLLWGSLIFFIFVLFSFLSLTFEMDKAFEVLKAVLFHYDESDQNQAIILSRIARIVVAFLVGASLAVSGLIMQLQFNNDLADPSLMGVSDGSALIIAASMIFIPQLSTIERIFFSILGSLLAYVLITCVVRLSFVNQSPLSFPLIGIVVSMLLSSITTYLVSYYNLAQSVSSWYNSRLYRVSFSDVSYFLPLLFMVICLLIILKKQMDIYAYDEEITISLGMNRKRWAKFYSLVVVVLTGVSIAIVGRLAFIGLIVPHIVKLVVGKRYSIAIFFVPVVGGLLVLISDYISRLVHYPFETPVGVVIALVGVPIFLYLIRRGAGVRWDV